MTDFLRSWRDGLIAGPVLFGASLLMAGSALGAEALAPPAIYPADTWQGRSSAVLRVLDRLDAHAETITVPAGATGHYKSLDITVARCLDRPKTLASDAAAWLDLHDQHKDGQTFSGWMLAAEPSLGVFESPVYDVRLVRCDGDVIAPTPPALPTPAVPVLPGGQPAPATDGVTPLPAPSGTSAPTQLPAAPSNGAPVPLPAPAPVVPGTGVAPAPGVGVAPGVRPLPPPVPMPGEAQPND